MKAPPSRAPTAAPPLEREPQGRRPYRAAGREKQKRETQLRILECALRHFSERGFEAASLREIATEAGITHAAIRAHFGAKEDLWRAAIGEMFARHDAELDFGRWTASDRLTKADLRDLIHQYVRYCAHHPEHIRIMMHETLRDSDRVRWIVEHYTRQAHAPFIRLISRAMDEGLLPSMPPSSLMYILTAGADNFFALGAEVKQVYSLDVQDAAVIDAHAEAMCTLFLRDGTACAQTA